MRTTIKQLLTLGIPLSASRFMHTLNTFIVMLFIAQLGHDALAASFTMATTRIILLVIFMSPLFAIGSLVSRQQPDLSEEKIGAFLLQSWFTALLLAMLPVGILSFLSPLLHALHQPKQLIPLITDYFNYYRWALPAIYLTTVNTQYLAAKKKQNQVFLITVINLILSLLANAVLIFGYIGLPALGVTGAGIASILTAWTGFILSCFLLARLGALQTIGRQSMGLANSRLIFKIGLPIGLHSASGLLVLFALMIMTGWLGESVLSASQIANEYALLILLIFFGLGEACTLIAGQMITEKDRDGLQQISQASVLISLSITSITGLIVALFHRPLADLFINFNEANALSIYHLALWLLAIRIFKMLLSGPVQMLTGLLRGSYDTLGPLRINLLTGWGITLPLSYLFAMYLNWGIYGIMAALFIAEATALYALRRRWQQHCQRLLA